MLKKSLSIIMCIAMLFVLGTNADFAESQVAESKFVPVNIQVNYDSAQENKDGTTTYNVLNADEVAKAYGIDDAKSVQLTIFNYEQNLMPATKASSSIYIDKVKRVGNACGTEEITRNSAANQSNYKINKVITLNGTVSNDYSLSVDPGINVKAASISSAVGFSVSKSWSMSDSTEVSLNQKQSVTVYAYPLYDVYSFNVMKDPLIGSTKKVGSGYAYKCKGFCTVVR